MGIIRTIAFFVAVLLQSNFALAQYMPEKSAAKQSQLKSYEFPSLQQKHKWHCAGTRIGEGMFIASDVFLAAAGYTYAMDRSADRNQLPMATSLFSLGLGLGFNGAIYFGAGKAHEAALLKKQSRKMYLSQDSTVIDNYRIHRRYSYDNFGTVGGKILMSVGGVLIASGGVMALSANSNNETSVAVSEGYLGAGLVFIVYGAVFYGCGQVRNGFYGSGFGLFSKGNSVGLAYNF